MAEVMFYHLGSRTLDDVLPVLLERTLARGWRAVVEVPEAERLAALDAHLWTYREDSFLPHAAEREDDGTRQPVWLTTGSGNPNQANVRFLADGAEPKNVDDYQRVVLIFSSDDAASIGRARAAWKPLKAAGHDCTYWQQDAAGRWEKKA